MNTSIAPQSRKAIRLGFSIEIPPGLYGRIAPRSGLALKNNIDVAAGVIDPDYRGEVKVLLVNSSQKKFDIKEGDKIAQLIFEKVASPAFRVLRSLAPTVRGSGGFGSTNTARVANSNSPPNIIPNHDENQQFSDSLPPQKDISNSLKPSPHKSPNIVPHYPTEISNNSDTPLVHNPPPIRPIDKPQDVSSASKTVTVEELRRLLGYRNTDKVLEHAHTCFQNNFHISNIEREPTLELGEVATINRTKISTRPVPLPKNFGDAMHVDIGYEFAPKKLVTDFDHKLFGTSIEDYFRPQKTTIEVAPPRMQNKNGLVERNWRSVVRMARSWLTSALLPSNFWFYAIKRTVETSNYLPVTLNGIPTTPFELVHHHKPDIRALIPLFSIAYIDHPHTGTTATPTMSSQSLRVILVGRSAHSTALEFYHPPTKQIYSSSVYKLDPTLASGPIFGLHYNGGLFFNTYHNEADLHIAPTFATGQIVYFQPQTENEVHVQAKVIGVPLDESTEIYTLQRSDNKNIIQMPIGRIKPYNPQATPLNDIIHTAKTLPHYWVKDNAPATIFLKTMPKPRRGLLRFHTNNSEWYFHFGRTNRTEPIHLKNFNQDGLKLIQDGQLMRGHPTFSTIYQQRQSQVFQESVARHVSAANLKNLDVPTLIQMQSLENHDKNIWKAAYDEEYYGLEKLPAWTHISQEEYEQLRPTIGNLLPTMAISTIKYDENGNPKRCKWRIVALGNLDPHSWSNNECYAPVLSSLEVRLLTSLSIFHKRTLKNGDIKQAFCQAVLPHTEQYALCPPPGCPNTPPKTYWLLKRTLYGLKRSPRHWFIKATELLAQCGLHPTPNNPCLFVGKPDGENVLYLGLYVDDLCYFSPSDKCEKIFENKLQSLTKVDFMGEISHFLGIKFDTIRENAIRESVDKKFIEILHINGKINIADIFTKEMEDTQHFITLRNLLVSKP